MQGICDNDGGKLVQRADDRPEVVKERLAAYERQTKPLADYYRRQGVLDSRGRRGKRGRSEPCARVRFSSVRKGEMVICKSPAELEKMHQAGLIVWGALEKMRAMIQPGISTKELDEFAEAYTAEHHARPAFKGYRGYPGSVCTSINQEVVHGIPSPLAASCARATFSRWILASS